VTERAIGPASISESTIRELRGEIRGRVIVPGDETYDQVRAVWNAMIDRRPAVIVRALGARDVMTSVNFARGQGLAVSVRGGGHGVAGNAVCDDGLMLDLSLMKGVRVYPNRDRVRAEPGLTWGEFDRETQTFGLATTGGLVSTTGIAGFTLGGGIGWLVRKHGLALDSLMSADVVTADGELVMASSSENPELFWGVRGGGGNFGVVTSLEYQLHPVGPIVLGGMLVHRAEAAPELLRFYREFVKDVPNELTTLAVYLTAPPAPFLPSEIHGKKAVAIALCYAGAVEEGEKVLSPLRRFGKPVADLIRPMPYLALQMMFDESAPPGVMNYWKSSYIDELSDSAIDTILEQGAKITSPLTAIHIHQLGGASAKPVDLSTSYSHRDAKFIVNLVGTWTNPTENQRHIDWTRDSFAALSKFAIGAYVNFMGEEGEERVKAAYGAEKFSRLTSLKNKYDPSNLFRFNQNIKPSSPGPQPPISP
jgi:FAD/FMN-containing dehydrogenase